MSQREVIEQIDIEKSSEKEHILRVDNRGRITIPKRVRNRHGVNPTDGNEIWAEITLHNIEVREDADGGDSA